LSTEILRSLRVATSRNRTESESVALCALTFLGRRYRITREFVPGYIDCSTVVSQAHWWGAAVQTPFIADTQLQAVNSERVDLASLLPGDAIYLYSSGSKSPGGKHNHVVLFVGLDESGRKWGVESRDPDGVRLTPIDALTVGGGIRRFCPSPGKRFEDGMWAPLVRRVPKLGRIGARLTFPTNTSIRHVGTDIYLPPRTAVYSPLSGHVDGVLGRSRGCKALAIQSTRGYRTILAPIAECKLHPGDPVEQGDWLGLSAPVRLPGCNIVQPLIGTVPVHWEVWGRSSQRLSAPGLSEQLSFVAPPRSSRPRYCMNAAYLLKMGWIGSPFSVS
jgi:hypothetical protein